MRRRRPSPRLGNVVLYSVPSRRGSWGRLKWLLCASAAVFAGCGLAWWVISPGNSQAGPNAQASTKLDRPTATPTTVATMAPRPAPRATSVSDELSTPTRTIDVTRRSKLHTPSALVSRTHPPRSPVRLAGPPERWVRAPAAGLAGIGKHVRIGTGEGSGPGWCLANGGYPFGANVDGVWACGPS